MTNHCLSERASSLIGAASGERHNALSLIVQHIREEMNSRGILNSSIYANKLCHAYASELKSMAEVIWQSIRRAHESCGSRSSKNLSKDLRVLFCDLLENEKTKLEQLQEETLGGINLQNKALIQSQLLADAHDSLIHKYDTEIDIYVDNLKRDAGHNFAERLKNGFLNYKLIVVPSIIVAVIIVLAEFTDALNKLSTFVKSVLGNG